jgi:hypothetical protein
VTVRLSPPQHRTPTSWVFIIASTSCGRNSAYSNWLFFSMHFHRSHTPFGLRLLSLAYATTFVLDIKEN